MPTCDEGIYQMERGAKLMDLLAEAEIVFSSLREPKSEIKDQFLKERLGRFFDNTLGRMEAENGR